MARNEARGAGGKRRDAPTPKAPRATRVAAQREAELSNEAVDLPQRDVLSVLDPSLVGGGVVGAVLSPSPDPVDTPTLPDGTDTADPVAAEAKPTDELTSDPAKLGNVAQVPRMTGTTDA